MGHVRWKDKLDGKLVRTLIVAPNGNVYLDVDNRMEALDGSTGSHLWSAATATNYGISQVATTRSAVYVEQEAYFLPGSQPQSTYDSAVVRALNLDSGHQIWRAEVANTSADQLDSLDRVSMQVDNRAIYLLRVGQVPETHGLVTESVARTTLFALHAEDGSPLWSDQTHTGDAGIDPRLFLSSQTLYIAGAGTPSSLSAFQTRNGQSLWSWQTPFVLNPFQPPNHIYGSSLNKGESFCALRSSDGSIAWCSNYNQAGPVLFGGPGKICLVAFKITYQGTSETESPAQLYILNESDGSLVAQYSPGSDQVAQIQSMALS
jgi:outer membrane protein assembly factor BamB